MLLKKPSITTRLALASSLALISLPLLSETQRDLDSHEHGASAMNIVQDGNTYYIEFESPWMNLVGFEHEPSTAEQEESLNTAMAELENNESLFAFGESSGCERTTVEVMSSMAEEHENEEGHDDHEKHSEVHANYSFTCASIDNAESLSVGFFKVWPGIEDIDVQIVGPGGQSSEELNSTSNTINLKQVQ